MKWQLASSVVICGVAAGCARSAAISEGSGAETKGQGTMASAPRDGTAPDSGVSRPEGHGSSNEDASEDVSSGDAGESEAAPEDASDVQEVDAADAAVGEAGRDAADAERDTSDAERDAADAESDASDAARDAATCAYGIRSLSNIGTQDFHVSFRVTTKQTGWMALVSQRSACYLGVFWDIRQCGAGAFCPADGELFVETEGDTNGTSYQSVHSTVRINDGTPHDIEVARVSGVLTIRIDGALSGTGASSASLGTMPTLQIGTDACFAGNPATAAFAAGTTLSDLCLTSP